MASILLIEDEATILNSYTFVLEKHGYTVTGLSNGAQALEATKASSFDLIIVDMLMPEMSGLDFLRQANLKTTMPAAKVLVLSNTESPKIMEEAKQLGALKYILKVSVTPSQLVDIVDETLKA